MTQNQAKDPELTDSGGATFTYCLFPLSRLTYQQCFSNTALKTNQSNSDKPIHEMEIKERISNSFLLLFLRDSTIPLLD